ncbi:CRISPR-associated helicase Cas3' [Miniphocaeibacter halophilus]|uniref:CRISPR-associated helicase Cas3 n=1 Tax=Miniphocaeibacter halophilus TaxID=2931922 RepID=A0AC61N0J8_9FIRM|nr:CRISPR-associated helicase Cas3' [Miniphocaeibacter halophilus]QQK08749.1 CRISPR-associated helicase Cas3' [Miniphocaeibacter halophilus]
MNEYLAKSKPRETIQEHTDNLVKNFKILKEIYPNLNINWDILYWAVIYHDLGKMNLKFQSKLKGKRISGEIPHGILSLAFIDYEKLEDEEYSEEDIRVLFHAVAYHHDRKFDFSEDELIDEISLMEKEVDNFYYDKIPDLIINEEIEADYFYKNDRIFLNENKEGLFFKYTLIKGLLNRLDYAASAYIPVERKNDFLVEGMEKLGFIWNDLQKFMLKNQSENLIVVAQTGMGKTEGGLLWIGDNKGFFILPLKTAINAIYDRVVQIIGNGVEEKVGLLHSDTYKEYLAREKDEKIGIDDYFKRTKQLSLPLTICTLDQLFDLVYRYPGFEQKLATLSYSKIVIDEIQMYSPDLLAYLIIGLEYINKVGGKFAILTATLPGIIVDLLKESKIEFKMPEKPFIDNELKRHSVKILDNEIDKGIILEKYKKNKVLIICNTVKKAQEIYGELKEYIEKERLNLFHSKYIRKDRGEKEQAILEIGSKNSKEYGIWIATQIVEASLDIDFDILLTELSDLNGLFQRMGRCYRKRNFEGTGYNCYVFCGKGISGVNKVVDKDIHKFSKEALKNIDGFITEENKINMIDKVYSTKSLENTEYYKKLKKSIKYVKSFEDYELTKSETRDRFRNISSWNIIPKTVYDKNIDKIEELMKIIKEKHISREERFKAKLAVLEYTVAIYEYDYYKYNVEGIIELSKYERIYIYNCEYSKELGFKNVEKQEDSINNII